MFKIKLNDIVSYFRALISIVVKSLKLYLKLLTKFRGFKFYFKAFNWTKDFEN